MIDRLSEPFSQLIVEGQTEDGSRFRPSDWMERLIDTVTAYGADRRASTHCFAGQDRRRRQIAFLQTQFIEGHKCLVVDARLQDANPQAYRYLLDFIRDNRLCYRIVN
jgi:hypothetical protein